MSTLSDKPPRCPDCGAVLKAIEYPEGSMLNYEQWRSVRQGDWVCEFCPARDVDQGMEAHRYFWNPPKPASAASPSGAAPTEIEFKCRAILNDPTLTGIDADYARLLASELLKRLEVKNG